MPLSFDPELRAKQLSNEARAQIVWGDSPEKVSNWLCREGLTEIEAAQIVGTHLLERRKFFENLGARYFFGGALFVCVSYFLVTYHTPMPGQHREDTDRMVDFIKLGIFGTGLTILGLRAYWIDSQANVSMKEADDGLSF